MLYFTVKLRRNDRELKMPAGPLHPAWRDIPGYIHVVYTDCTVFLAVPAVNFIDSSIVKPLLIGQVGLGQATAAVRKPGTERGGDSADSSHCPEHLAHSDHLCGVCEERSGASGTASIAGYAYCHFNRHADGDCAMRGILFH